MSRFLSTKMEKQPFFYIVTGGIGELAWFLNISVLGYSWHATLEIATYSWSRHLHCNLQLVFFFSVSSRSWVSRRPPIMLLLLCHQFDSCLTCGKAFRVHIKYYPVFRVNNNRYTLINTPAEPSLCCWRNLAHQYRQRRLHSEKNYSYSTRNRLRIALVILNPLEMTVDVTKCVNVI